MYFRRGEGLMICKTRTAALWGLEGFEVTVEAFSGRGVPSLSIIGLPDAAVQESLSRIHAACQSASLPLPRSSMTINLAPADRKKQGSGFDLAIAVAMLSATVLQGVDLESCGFFGELSLDGALRGVTGALPLATTLREAGVKDLFVPLANSAECSVVEGIRVYGVAHISDLVAHLRGAATLESCVFDRESAVRASRCAVDFADIRGQESAKRAAEIAAAGKHNLLLIGPPGSGKSMLSKAIPGILPKMDFQEMLECTKIHSVAGLLPEKTALLTERPFRAPHHTISFAGLAGGGVTPQPGEISLCHNGVLFLDELPEFEKRSLEILRQPLEDHAITVTRAGWKMTFPANFMLVCAMNPCPCGYYGSDSHPCTCTKNQIERYLSKISGPLLDRVDLKIEVPAVSFDELSAPPRAETSETVRRRVDRARQIARERYRAWGVSCNGDLSPALTRKFCVYDKAAEAVLRSGFVANHLSGRGFDRILRLARTIADLEESEIIGEGHVLEALQFRFSSGKYFS